MTCDWNVGSETAVATPTQERASNFDYVSYPFPMARPTREELFCTPDLVVIYEASSFSCEILASHNISILMYIQWALHWPNTHPIFCNSLPKEHFYPPHLRIVCFMVPAVISQGFKNTNFLSRNTFSNLITQVALQVPRPIEHAGRGRASKSTAASSLSWISS